MLFFEFFKLSQLTSYIIPFKNAPLPFPGQQHLKWENLLRESETQCEDYSDDNFLCIMEYERSCTCIPEFSSRLLPDSVRMSDDVLLCPSQHTHTPFVLLAWFDIRPQNTENIYFVRRSRLYGRSGLGHNGFNCTTILNELN